MRRKQQARTRVGRQHGLRPVARHIGHSWAIYPTPQIIPATIMIAEFLAYFLRADAKDINLNSTAYPACVMMLAD